MPSLFAILRITPETLRLLCH